MTRIFLSHSTRDRDFVAGELAPLLEKHGFASWFAPTEIRPSEDFERKIAAGLQQCELFLVVLTPDAAVSEWVRAEIAWAVANRPRRITPLMLISCSPSDAHLRLGNLHYVDFRQRGGAAEAALLKTLDFQVQGADGSLDSSRVPPGKKPADEPQKLKGPFPATHRGQVFPFAAAPGQWGIRIVRAWVPFGQ